MSNEMSTVPPTNNNESLEPQLQSPPQQYQSNTVQPTSPPHHVAEQVRAQPTMSNEMSTVPPNNNNGSLELQLQSPPQQYQSNTVQPTSPIQYNRHPVADQQDALRKKGFKEMRGWIMVVAVLVASVTYTTGLSPPGGFWQEDHGNHKAGSAILRDKLPHRYTIFFYANATAFMASLVIIAVLLMHEKFSCDRSKVLLLNITMVLDLVSLMIAYAAGCARSLNTFIYVSVLALGILLIIVVYSTRLHDIRLTFQRRTHSLGPRCSACGS